MLVDTQVDKSLIVSRMGLDRIMLEGERTARHMSLSLHCRNSDRAKLMPAGICYRPVPRPPSVTLEAIFYSWLLRTLITRRRLDEGVGGAQGGSSAHRTRNSPAPRSCGVHHKREHRQRKQQGCGSAVPGSGLWGGGGCGESVRRGSGRLQGGSLSSRGGARTPRRAPGRAEAPAGQGAGGGVSGAAGAGAQGGGDACTCPCSSTRRAPDRGRS